MQPSPDNLESAGPRAAQQRFPCASCGAAMQFEAGTAALRCSYCGHEQALPVSDDAVVERDYHDELERGLHALASRTFISIKCDACGADVERPPDITADACPFCGTDLVGVASSAVAIKPQALLPFEVTRAAAERSFVQWLRRLWFAPSSLQRIRSRPRMNGLYVPHWTYDCFAESDYRGKRGDDYWVTESYQTTVNGRSVTQTRRVRRTRWTNVSGHVLNEFDDLLVNASRSLPEKLAARLEPWDLASLVSYADGYLAGFRAERHQISLADGFDVAQERMQPRIRDSIRGDIGGDHQVIDDVQTRYENITFKHILLPVWLSVYRYREKPYRFVVNARTGEVQGERPWSAWKIAGFVVTLSAAVGAAAYLLSRFTG